MNLIHRWVRTRVGIGTISVLMATVLVGACQSDDTNADYLEEMTTWHQEWSDTSLDRTKDAYDPVSDDLLKALWDIKPPGELYSEHRIYLTTHTTFLQSDRHLQTMRDLERGRFQRMGYDDIPACDIARYIDVSLEFSEACTTRWLAYNAMLETRLHWEFNILDGT